MIVRRMQVSVAKIAAAQTSAMIETASGVPEAKKLFVIDLALWPMHPI